MRTIVCLRAYRLAWAAAAAVVLTTSLGAADLCQVVLFDGERQELLNTWGGGWGRGNALAVRLQSERLHSGKRALEVVSPAIKANDRFFFQCFPSGFGPSAAYHQTRDITRYERLSVWVNNATGTALSAVLQIKDHRDSTDHCAVFRSELPADEQWTELTVPLTFDHAGWKLIGQPDLSRVVSIDFVLEAATATSGGSVYVDDFVLIERGGPIDPATAPFEKVAKHMARRQWDALWSVRNREHGLIPNTSYQATDAALNGTSGLVWLLPAAVRHGWVAQAEADQYMTLLLRTINRLLDEAKYVPPRNVDWVTLKPSLLPEESAVDAAFLAIALHHYKSQPHVAPELKAAIDKTQNRFNFAAFACPLGWRMAYRHAMPPYAEGFTAVTYDGYTNEGNIVSLAAHISRAAHVPIETHWNASARRSREGWSNGHAPLVHSWRQFRAPFTQALLNLFVDVRDYGADRYPNRALAANPWENFVCYQQSVMTRLGELGRSRLVQPDAGDDGSLGNYQQFSLYEDFGQTDLFMPWSAAFPLLAGADGAEPALRFLLQHGLHDTLGLVDSAKWKTGATAPYAVTARHDFWNTALSTMALVEWIDGDARLSKSFAALPEMREALARVFEPRRDPEAVTAVAPPAPANGVEAAAVAAPAPVSGKPSATFTALPK